MAKNKTAPSVAQSPVAKAAGAAVSKAPAQDPVVTHLHVTSRRAGFRRAGRAWPAEAVTVSADEFSGEQIEQLFAEPMLTVVAVAAAEEGEQ